MSKTTTNQWKNEEVQELVWELSSIIIQLEELERKFKVLGAIHNLQLKHGITKRGEV